MSPLAQAILTLLEKLAEDELPIILNWIEGRLAPGRIATQPAPADPNATQPAPADPVIPVTEPATKP
jgi:hypothetical protein